MTERQYDTKSFKNARGESFRVLVWPSLSPSSSPRKTLLFIHHGHGEHAGRYASIARALADVPVEIRAFDCRGHGMTDGARGNADSVDHLAADLDAILPAMKEQSGADQVILFGHSMGGGVVARWITTRAAPAWLKGVVLSAPLLRAHMNAVQKAKLAVGRALAKVAPAFTMGTGLPASAISTVPEEVRRYKSDPLVHDRVNAALGVDWFVSGAASIESAPSVAVPILGYHGTADTAVDPAGTRAFFDRVGSQDKAYHELQGVRHEPHHAAPADAAKAFALLKDFVVKHSA